MGGVLSSVAAKLAFFPPNPPTYNLLVKDTETGLLLLHPHPHRENVDVLKLRTRLGNDIVAVYIRCPEATTTLLYSHPNAADIGRIYGKLLQLSADLKINILGYDCSGYGQSTGKPMEGRTYADIEAAYRCLEETYGAKQEDVILYGESIGSGPTVDLATKLPRLKGIVLHGAILSGLRVMCYVERTYSFDIYPGASNRVVNLYHGRKLWELSGVKHEPLWIGGGTHHGLEKYPEYLQHLRKFVSTVGTDSYKPMQIERITAEQFEKFIKERQVSRISSMSSTDKLRKSLECPESPPNSIDSKDKPSRGASIDKTNHEPLTSTVVTFCLRYA